MHGRELELEHELAALLDVERFEPPRLQGARAPERSGDLREGRRDWKGWWERQARTLHWFKPWDQVLDDSNPPFYKWFVGGKLNVSYNCLDRHVEAGKGDKVAFHWHGEEGDSGRSPTPICSLTCSASRTR